MSARRLLDSLRTEVRPALVAMGIGMVIAGLFALGFTSSRRFGVFIFHGALTGLAIYVAVSILEHLVRDPVARIRSSSRRTAAHIAVFSAGGTIGWLVGMAVAFPSLSHILDRRWIGFMALTVSVVIAVGLMFRAFDALHRRVREQEWAEKELQIARSIQERLLPPPKLDGRGYALAARNLPAQIVAGDFYDFVPLEDGSVAIIIADVAGKGVGASLIMASVKAVLPFIAHRSVAAALSQLNDKLLRELARREFVALAYARFYPDDGRLELANAGLPDPYVLQKGTARPLVVQGLRLPLGIRSGTGYETAVAQLERGDRVVFLSDGIPEASTAGGDLLGYEQLQEIVAETRGSDASGWLDAFIESVQARVNTALSDDWTVVVLERR
ncbi:MAG TPA: SpoIIE family protein phosphatase [Thermoanaerobaculia bacterium]|nr:SpoIIE family protein phosphatase [Thermoanaerobaculia bacterium]